MPVPDPGHYYYKVTFVPDNPQSAFPELDIAPREAVAVTRQGAATPEQFARMFPGQNYLECIEIGCHNAEEEFFTLTGEHLDPDNSAILPRLQARLQTDPPRYPAVSTPENPLPRLKPWRELDPAVGAALLDLFSEYYYAFLWHTAEDDPDIEDAASLAKQLGITAADLEQPAAE